MTDPVKKAAHVNSATLIMGATGSGKSSLLATLMEYVWETWQQVSILYSSDGGGFPDRVQALIKLGICWPFRMRTRDLPDGSLSFETIARSTQGWFPSKINLQTGEVPQGVRMIPPVTEKYDMHCPNGHLLKSVPFQAMLTPQLCPTCRIHTTKANMRVSKSAHRTAGMEKVGAVMYDGISSMTTWVLSDMGQRAGRLELKGEEGAIGGKITSGDMKWGGSTRSHVGFAQSRAEEWILNALGIPYLRVPPTFTALTLETSDEGGLSVRGPKLAGRAKTDEAPAWFGNCLESAVIKTEKDERVHRLYLAEFVDDAGVRHLVKHRGAPGTMPPYLEDQPIAGNEAETAFENFNLGVFFRLLDAGLQTTIARATEKYPDAPGSEDRVQEFGEAGSADAAGDASVSEGTTPAPAPAPPAVPVAGTPPQPGPAAPKAPPAAPPGTNPGTKPKAAAPRPGKPKPASQAAPAAPVAPVAPAAPVPVPEPPVASSATAPAPPTQPTQAVGAPAPPAPPVQAAQPPIPPGPSGPGTPRAWAPPGAPRPPAPAPRVGPSAPKPSR